MTAMSKNFLKPETRDGNAALPASSVPDDIARRRPRLLRRTVRAPAVAIRPSPGGIGFAPG
ncbi:hypothetical protein [Burkholderia sp. MSMB2157WGS]|uniref:hypothetical protein n=1 Tax=Burkholderia sp. MSMB2157WGS TaxID=1637928 RepID=UPI0012E35706|nr:hypothetical protein [Burkholderia sp. MSMB2157WGS]